MAPDEPTVPDEDFHRAWVVQGRENRDLYIEVGNLKAAIHAALGAGDIDAMRAILNEAAPIVDTPPPS